MTRTPRGPRAPRRRRPVGLIVALLAILMTSGIAWQASASNSLPAPGWDVSVTPTVDLLDGDVASVVIKANDNVDIFNAEVRECRFGPTYAAAIDVNARSGNCPLQPVSSSADLVLARSASDGLIGDSKSDAGARIDFHVGQGTTNWETATGPASLTCDLTTPCALVVRLDISGVADPIFRAVKISFTDADPIVACGGTAPGVLHAAASDELADAWAKWTRAYCAANPGGAPSSTAFPGEGPAINGFLSGGTLPGDLDLSYGSAGIDPATGMILPATPKRGTIAVPVALNAAVLAAGGGFRLVPNSAGAKAQYAQVSMPATAAAAMLSGGNFWAFQQPGAPYSGQILATNQQLRGVAYWTGSNVLAPSLPLTSVWLLSKYFAAVTPNDWVNRRDSPPTKHGAVASLASANPPFTDTSLLTGRPAMGKAALAASLNDPDGPLWVFTDRATAASLKLTPVAMEDQLGVFVAPDNASMSAAVADMVPNAQGVLQPVIKAATAADGLGVAAIAPYPMTYVEYAFVPAEQLVDPTTCQARTASQTLLKNWLTYVTSTGQTNLAAGLEPLTDELKTQAADAIAKIGALPTTGPCAGKVTPETTPGGASAPGATGAAAPGPNVPSFGATLPAAGLSNPAAAAAAAADAAAGNKRPDAVAVPAFAGHKIADPLGGVVSLIGIVLILSLGAWITAGGSLSGGGQLTPGSLGALTPRRVGSLALLWGGVSIACLGLVLFQLGPMLEQRDQKSLLADYRAEVDRATHETQGLPGAGTGTDKAPERGSAVGILEIPALKTQDVVVEGVEASQTRSGPGHVPGTAGLGQPSNSVVVARRNGYGGSFAGIGSLLKGDRIVVTTTQGRSVYAVSKICEQTVVDGDPNADSSTASSPLPSSSSSSAESGAANEPCTTGAKKATTNTATAASPEGATTTTVAGATTTTVAGATTTTGSGATTTTAAGATTTTGAGAQAAQPAAASKSAGGTYAGARTKATVTLSVDQLYGISDNDRLTLVTSAEKAPWNSSRATIVVAKLLTKPFEPTTQGTRDSGETGFGRDPGAWSSVVLALMAFVAVIVASVALYRKMRFRVAYVLTIAPLVALTIIAGETLARLLPAWT